MELEIARGTSLVIELTVLIKNSESDFVPEPTDVFRFGVKKNAFQTSELISKSYPGTDYNSNTGTLDISLVPSDTASLNFGTYLFDIGLQRGEDYYQLVKASPFKIVENVTQWTELPEE